MIQGGIYKVALIIRPDGKVERKTLDLLTDDDISSLVGVYNEHAREEDIVAAILELAT